MKRRDPDEARRRLFEVAQTQAGYFTSSQASAAGYLPRLQHYHVHRGHWLRIDRALYRLREYPTSSHEDLVRWSLWSHGKAVISHDTAAAVVELGDLLPARIHLTVGPGFRKAIPPVVILHRARLDPKDVQTAGGFTLTTPLRTVLDLVCSDTESDRVVAVVRDALTRGAVRRPALEQALARLDLPARERGERILRLALERGRAV